MQHKVSGNKTVFGDIKPHGNNCETTLRLLQSGMAQTFYKECRPHRPYTHSYSTRTSQTPCRCNLESSELQNYKLGILGSIPVAIDFLNMPPVPRKRMQMSNSIYNYKFPTVTSLKHL